MVILGLEGIVQHKQTSPELLGLTSGLGKGGGMKASISPSCMKELGAESVWTLPLPSHQGQDPMAVRCCMIARGLYKLQNIKVRKPSGKERRRDLHKATCKGGAERGWSPARPTSH